MKVPWIVLSSLVCLVIVLALVLPGAIPPASPPALPAEGRLPGTLPNGSGTAVPVPNGTVHQERTALFSKTIAAGTPYIIVSLYSGDLDDPISVTVITPDSTLGPFYDSSDGKMDGRIELKISNPDTMKAGTWKFVIHSRKPIATGNLENLSWIRTGEDRKGNE
jgi:hypothetical protein